jgi:hypothetical protein
MHCVPTHDDNSSHLHSPYAAVASLCERSVHFLLYTQMFALSLDREPKVTITTPTFTCTVLGVACHLLQAT